MVKLSYISKITRYLTKRGLIVPSLLICITSVAQPSLVPNGSFEDYISCPAQVSDFDGYVSDWYNPSDSLPHIPTPDFFNSCSNPSVVGVPQNFWGNLNAKDGVGYAGIFLYSIGGTSPCGIREYIGIGLLAPLKKDSIYDLKMHVSFAENYNGVALSNIGAVLSKDSIIQYLSCPIVIPDSSIILKNAKDSIIHNPGSWKKLTFHFKASGGEEFLYIGNFDSDTELDSMHYNTQIGSIDRAYYLIDDVSLTRATSVGVDENEIGNKIKIFPNPASDGLTVAIDNSLNGGFQLRLFDADGRFIANYPMQGGVNELDVSTISNGLYIYDISRQGKVIEHGKIVIYK